ncbi:MAG: DNA polymerase III subunit gamma/tau [Solirubrobacterales bacterium]|nr:DNA polymerase III subunit gamma/tau [Solirubrobacterales bacterium]
MPDAPSLYRRHRPRTFGQVVGQEHVVRTLRNAVEQEQVHHAYLFVGSRGTGKTSMAKILATCLNCERGGPTVEPCLVCGSCRAIANATSLDVIEMDAASNNSVDDIRELRERVSYAPAAGRWKVYILDEAHMLTREAWNAFLKTLEEPPPNTVFVLATTEPHKVMATIVDRCQRFDFGRPSPEEIAVVLRRVAAAEEITVEDGAVGAIARAARGSFRDGLGTLDQLFAYSGNEIATEDVLAVLGVADVELLFAAAEAIAASDGRGALTVSSDLARSGRDPARFASDLVEHLRQLLVIGTLGEIPEHFLVIPEHEGRLADQAARLGEVSLVRAIDHLSEATAAIREGDEPRMSIELALLRSARPEIDPSSAAIAQRLERLERGTAAPAPSASTPAIPSPPVAPTPAPLPAQQSQQAQEPHAVPASAGASIAHGAVATAEEVRHRPAEPKAPAGEPPTAVPETNAAAIDLDRIAGLWPAVIEGLRQSGAGMLAAAFDAARPVAVDPGQGVLEVGFPSSAAFNRRKAEAKDNRDQVIEAIRTVIGVPLRPVFVTLDDDHEDAASADMAPPTDGDAERELLERFVSEFDAEVLTDEEPERQETS